MGLGQKHDYVWYSGYESYGYNPNTYDSIVGTNKIFFDDQFNVERDSLGMDFERGNMTMCDPNGNLLFYTNYVRVDNALQETMVNGDSLSYSNYFSIIDPGAYTRGVRYPDANICVPTQNPSRYIIFSSMLDASSQGNVEVNRLNYSVIDVSAANGRGELVIKDSAIVQEKLSYAIAATKTGDAKGWWLVYQKENSNCLGISGIDSTENIIAPKDYCGGLNIDKGEVNNLCFTSDGKKLVAVSNYTNAIRSYAKVSIYDFDRCTGTLLLTHSFNSQQLIDSGASTWGLSSSPNSRFVYLFSNLYLFQLDLQSPNPESALAVVGVDDGFMAPFGMGFFHGQLAADGKIYVGSGNGSYYLHTIHNPDDIGASCNLALHDKKLPAVTAGVPYYPNYRLEATSCTGTSINEIADKEKILKVYPNPANDIATIDYGYTDWSQGEATMEIANSLGQLAHKQNLPMYSGFQKVDVSNYASGSYTVLIKRGNTVVATGKLVKE